MIRVVHLRIQILIFCPSRILGSKRQRIPDPESATMAKAANNTFLEQGHVSDP
jgi:hypothetical protein